MLTGALFTQDFLQEAVTRWPSFRQALADAPAIRADLRALVDGIGDPSSLNEAQTEDRLVRPMLDRLGWAGLRVVQATATRSDIPDYLLFADPDAFARADALHGPDKFRHAVAVGDAKRWSIGLDQRGGGAGLSETPASQVLRYMDRAATRSQSCRWGLLTNGRSWRLYHQGASDRLNDYLEIDLLAALGLPGQDALPLFGLTVDPDHALALLTLFFGADGFGQHQRNALDEGRQWETRVRDDLAEKVFGTVYPGFVAALIAADDQAPAPLTPDYLTLVREAALTLLYRLLFVFYAEDRELLPKSDRRYDDYALAKARARIAEMLDDDDALSARGATWWRHVFTLFDIIDRGDDALGMPAYNGKLFAPTRSPLLQRVAVPDQAFAPLLDALSRRKEGGRRLWINYRDLSVRELGSIYERLLEYEPAIDGETVVIRLNPFARKGSGSYYTPDVLVRLIIEKTLTPLVEERMAAFERAVADASDKRQDAGNRRAWLDATDPGVAILSIKVCDPAMGSGHFLVDLVDWLADQAFTAIGRAEQLAEATGLEWTSPLAGALETLRASVRAEADANGWIGIGPEQTSDANLIKRLVLKRCVFGVDKNPMAVELAKVALWLHTFTAGAPLSFLDHHLACGDSLFGEWVHEAEREIEGFERRGRAAQANTRDAFLGQAIQTAIGSEARMRAIEASPDARLQEVENSEADYRDVRDATAPLKAFLDLWHGLKWLNLSPDDRRVVRELLDNRFGTLLDVAVGGPDAMAVPASLRGADGRFDPSRATEVADQPALIPDAGAKAWLRARHLVERALTIAAEQHFLHWQVAFPGVWSGWRDARQGGFDAVIGNPPWDRMKMQEVEWFAERAPAIARQTRAADRKAAIAALIDNGDPLAGLYAVARNTAEAAMRVARQGGAYPLLSRGDVNLYSLFVERGQNLIRPDGATGLLTPSGIASDLTASEFFKSVSTTGRVIALYDFENGRMNNGPAFPDVHRSFKFMAGIIGGPSRTAPSASCGFFLTDAPSNAEDGSPDPRLFQMTAADFARVNPNTGTAPIFRSARDAEITRAIYGRLPVLVDRSRKTERKAWPVKYSTMFHMTNDSGLFWTRARLEAEGAYEVGCARWAKGGQAWAPLYAGRMIQHFNHRAAGVETNDENLHNAALSDRADGDALSDPHFMPTPQYWVEDTVIDWPYPSAWGLAFRDIARSTDVRTVISSVVPKAGFGNKAPMIVPTDPKSWRTTGPLLIGNLNSIPFDFVARSKVMSTSVNWFIVEQLPVVPPSGYDLPIGDTTAGAIVRDHVLRLSYTAHDLAPFARDMGWVYAPGEVQADGSPAKPGEVKPPFPWDEDQRRLLCARLDALYFILYGVTDPDDVRHVLSTFPIVRRKDVAEHGVYLTELLVLWFLRALQAGDWRRDPPVADLIAQSRRAV